MVYCSRYIKAAALCAVCINLILLSQALCQGRLDLQAATVDKEAPPAKELPEVLIVRDYDGPGFTQKIQVRGKERPFETPKKSKAPLIPLTSILKGEEEAGVGGYAAEMAQGGCMLEVEYLGSEIYAGLTPVPTRMEYSVNGEPPISLFNGADLYTGQHQHSVDYIILGQQAPSTVTLIGKMGYPSYQNPLVAPIPSDHPHNAAILVDGDDWDQIMEDKGVQQAMASQLPIESLISPYIDQMSGTMQLADNQFIALWELGTMSTSSYAFDMQDLVVLVTATGCDVGSEVMLRDSIGPDNSTTNGNLAWSNFRTTGGTQFYITPVAVTSPIDLVLSQYRAIVTRQGFEQLSWPNQYFTIRVWNNMQAVISNPHFGNLANAILPSVPAPSVFGQTGISSPLGIRNTYEVSFDLLSFNIQLLAGQSYVIAVEARTHNATYGLIGTLESTEMGTPDTQVGTNGSLPVSSWSTTSVGIHRHSGRYAIELRGVPN